ncbi:basic helix-loop-helix transcription factor [Lithospermum erythrorhizon]|uniref:Basic helix-loop-helix transcription factor n=1 Tax=Lithospermum erythrorhizon TaxID=34254 RepID=A0AAV3PSR2_LITER
MEKSTSTKRKQKESEQAFSILKAHSSSACNSSFSMEEHYSQNNPSHQDSAEMEFQLQQQQQHRFDMLQLNSPMVQEMDATTWIAMNYHHPQDGHHHQSFNLSLPSDVVSMFPLTSCSQPTDLLQNPSISFPNSAQQFNLLTSLGLTGNQPLADGDSVPGVGYDPLFPLNLPPQPPPLRDLFHAVPHGHFLGNFSSGSLFRGEEDGDVNNGVLYHDSEGRPFTNGVFDFTSVVDKDGSKYPKHLSTEKQRRVHINDRYSTLRSLIPKPTKIDRASVVEDAIGYINELKMTVNELKILVEKKRCGRERMKRQKTEDGAEVITVVKTEDIDGQNSSALRSSWVQRRSKNTEVDVRIIDDEVTVKLVQQKRVNCLIFVSKVLDELQLDLHHVAGGLIGDYYSFLFNSKIYEGSSVYAHAIANKLIDAMDKQCATIQPNS